MKRSGKVAYQPRPEHHFTFGLWTVGNPGRDPFGEPVRPALSPVAIVRKLAELGAYGVNLHDNDLVPAGSTAAERDRIVREFQQVLAATGMKVPMATTNLFSDPAFRDGAFTSRDARVRAYALQKTLAAIDLGVELGATTYVCWGGRRFALEAKPNEPRGDIFLPTTGHMLAFIYTLDHPEMVGVNPEVAHERMAGLDFSHAVAQALEAGKLFHIDLNGQQVGRFDQDLRFGSDDPKGAFFLVKLLEDAKWPGMRHFDSHAYRTEDEAGVWDFAAGSMRTYLILKEKVERFNADPVIQQLLAEVDGGKSARVSFGELRNMNFDLAALRTRGYAYERLDQLTMELLLGVR